MQTPCCLVFEFSFPACHVLCFCPPPLFETSLAAIIGQQTEGGAICTVQPLLALLLSHAMGKLSSEVSIVMDDRCNKTNLPPHPPKYRPVYPPPLAAPVGGGGAGVSGGVKSGKEERERQRQVFENK